jgi:release factor glutamine methyltransferase
MMDPTYGSTAATGLDGPSQETWTIGRLLTWTSDYLKRHGSESPRLDAEVMLAHALSWQRVQLYTHFAEEIGDEPRVQFRELVRRRAEGAPVAYLVGRKEFYSLSFEVSSAVLIPRPDSEFTVVAFLEQSRELQTVWALDVGTGSGCLAIACARQHPGAKFVATDISPAALDVARRNAGLLDVAERIDFRLGDLFDAVAADATFDMIISNPPYIPTAEIERLERGVREYEPHAALDGGIDGLAIVKRLVNEAPRHLKPGGHLILEVGDAQEKPVQSMIEQQDLLTLAPTVFDLNKHPRVVRASRRLEG